MRSLALSIAVVLTLGVLLASVFFSPKTEQRITLVVGRVLADGRPVAGARVGFKGCTRRVVTDAEGRFRLPRESMKKTDGTRNVPATTRLVAAAEGFFIAGGDDVPGRDIVLRLRRPRDGDRPDYAWIDPRPDADNADACAHCHGAIHDEWSAGGHGLGHANRRFLGLYDGSDWEGNENVGPALLREAPEAAAVCASCHAPGVSDLAVINDLRKAGGVDRLGVHCDFCHKVAEVDLSRVGLDHGRFAMKLRRPPPGAQQFFGKLDDDDRGHSLHAAAFGESRFCAPCHEGIVFGKHQYSDYSDWLASDYARRGVQCQDCHMKPTGRMTNLAPDNGGMERDPLRLPSHRPTAGTPEALRACLKLALSGRRRDGRIEIVATVETQGIGHRFPAGHSARELLLVLDARDAAGHPLELLSGSQLKSSRHTERKGGWGIGSAATTPQFRRHWGVLAALGMPQAPYDAKTVGDNDCPPGRLYAKVFRGFDGSQPAADWTPGELAFDTRLAGNARDQSRYLFRADERGATVTARLIYRRFDPALAAAKRWPDNEVLIHEAAWCEPR